MSKTAKKSAPEAEKKPTRGSEAARLRRLERADVAEPGLCSLLGIELDTGPRALYHQKPVFLGESVVSVIAWQIIDSGISAKELRLAAKNLKRILEGDNE